MTFTGTLNQELTARGYTTESHPNPNRCAKYILRYGRRVACGRAGDIWDWLRRRERKLAALRGAK